MHTDLLVGITDEKVRELEEKLFGDDDVLSVSEGEQDDLS